MYLFLYSLPIKAANNARQVSNFEKASTVPPFLSNAS